jgi:pseudouridine synthase
MSKKTRIHQFLSKTGVFNSKRDIYNAIERGLVTIDGKTIVNKDYQFKVSATVKYENQEVNMIENNTYIILNKPQGYVCSRLTRMDKKLDKKSVYDLLHMDDIQKNSLSCVGRLDENSSGLLIMTSDGKLNIKVTNPDRNIKKTYSAVLKKDISLEGIKKLEEGIFITLEENDVETLYKTKPAKIKRLKNNNEIEITITEGKKRQVRRMIESVGNRVLSLKRIKINNLMLSMPVGTYKLISKEEIEKKLVFV